MRRRGGNTATTRELKKDVRAKKPTKRVELRGTERFEERELGVKPGGTRVMIRKNRKSLKFSLRGSVEIQAQHWPDWLCKPRTGSVWTDRLGRIDA